MERLGKLISPYPAICGSWGLPETSRGISKPSPLPHGNISLASQMLQHFIKDASLFTPSTLHTEDHLNNKTLSAFPTKNSDMNSWKPQSDISAGQWQKRFEVIRRLFITEDRTLSEVKNIMESDYKFHAT
jgi:hypothetical protein